MARISVKHNNQQIMEYRDFSGGLNTSTALEYIAMNELGKAINVELDPSTGLLKTVAGTEDIYLNTEITFFAFFYDKTNETFILVDTDRKIYLYHDEILSNSVGTLTGDLFPEFASWEEGVLIASGGHMQYEHGGAVETISGSPAVCNGVFIKTGRVWTYYEDTLHCSGVGDENEWESVSEVDSSAKSLEVGYKDTGKIVAVTNLSSDILILKDNGHAYHLYGDYPDWTLKEISRDIHCKGFRACTSLANSAMVLSNTMLQSVITTQDYGDMRADDISAKVRADIEALPANARIKFLPVLNQLWILNGKRKLPFMDCGRGSFFYRQFTSTLQDVIAVGDDVYLLKAHAIQRLKNRAPEDEGQPLIWEFWGKTNVSNNEFLVKRVRCCITPEIDRHYDCTFIIGSVPLIAKMPQRNNAVYQDATVVYNNKRTIYEPHDLPEYDSSELLYGNNEQVYGSEIPIVNANMYKTDKRCVQRTSAVRLIGRGQGSKFLFNSINYEYVEV